MKRFLGSLVIAVLVAGLGLPAGSARAEDVPTVSLKADRSVYVYSQTASFTVTVHAQNLDYRLAVQYPWSSEWTVFDGSNNVNDDVFTPQLATYYTMKIRAQLTDPAAADAVRASALLNIVVRPKMGITSVTLYRRSGGYAAYNKGTSPHYRSSSQPYAVPGAAANRCLRHVVQRHYASGWKNAAVSACRVENKQGQVDWTWAGKHASRVKFRVRATFAGDSANRASATGWFYFTFR